jgi:putative NADH-flavin reductase
MKLLIIGATGKTGIEIVNQSLAQDHEVTAFVRDPSKTTLENDRLHLVTGDVFDFATLVQAVQGQDAIICSLGTNSLGKTTVRSEGTNNIIKAMNENHVKRLLVVSAMGIGESWARLSSTNKIFFNTVLRNARKDHEKQEAFVKESGLDWTIVRPSGLTDTPLTKNYDIGEDISATSSQIARADVAHFILKVLDDDAFVGKAVTITN